MRDEDAYLYFFPSLWATWWIERWMPPLAPLFSVSTSKNRGLGFVLRRDDGGYFRKIQKNVNCQIWTGPATPSSLFTGPARPILKLLIEKELRWINYENHKLIKRVVMQINCWDVQTKITSLALASRQILYYILVDQ